MRMSTLGAMAALLALTLAGCAASTADTPARTDADPTVGGQSTSEQSTTEQSSGIPDPCLLLDPAVIEELTGYPVGEGYADPERQTDHSSLCEWTQTDDLGTVTVALAPGYPVPYEEKEGPLGATVKIEIPGATDAYSVNDGLSVGMKVDGTYVAVAFSGALDGERGNVTVALATEVAARLG
jgi:hypothetical protein